MGRSKMAPERLTPTEIKDIKEMNTYISFLLKLREEQGLEVAVKFIVDHPRF